MKLLSICGPEGRNCFECFMKKNPTCSDLPIPCQGFYADMSISQHGLDSLMTADNINEKNIFLEYENYKGNIIGNNGNSLSQAIGSDIKRISIIFILKKNVSISDLVSIPNTTLTNVNIYFTLQ